MPKAPTLKAPTLPKVPTLQVPKLAVPKVPKVAPPPPATLPQRSAAAKIHQPFIDMGHGIASGKESFI